MAASRHSDDERQLTLVASDVAPTGGMERVALELCSGLLDRGWRVTVIARSCALPAQDRLRFIRIPSPSRPVSLALLCDFVFASLALRRHRAGLVQTNNPVLPNRVDVIHAHFCESAYRRQVGLSRSRSSNPVYRLNSWLASTLALGCERWAYRGGRVCRVVCVSDGLAREVRQHYPGVAGSVRTIPNGVDHEAFSRRVEERETVRAELGVRADGLLALFVGGDWQRKGLRYAIEGLAGAGRWKLAVLGAGDPRAFSELAAELGVADRVLFVGSVGSPARYYGAADAFVLPSHYEAFGLVGLEAAAAGLPLVVSPLNGTEEYVRDGVNGWLTPRDGVAIASRLRALEDPVTRLQMGEAAARSAQQFGWPGIVDRWEALYRDLAEPDGTN